MTIKVPKLKYGSLLASIVMASLIYLAAKGHDGEIDLDELSATLEIERDELDTCLSRLADEGHIRRSDLTTAWSECSTICLGKLVLQVELLQLHLPEADDYDDSDRVALIGKGISPIDVLHGDTWYRIATVADGKAYKLTLAQKLGDDDYQPLVDSQSVTTLSSAESWVRQWLSGRSMEAS